MVYFLGFVTLLLAGAVVVLFAMLGELSARVAPGVPRAAGSVDPLAEAQLGAVPARWPAGIAAVGSASESIVLVLSTSCSSCQQVAQQVREQPALADGAAVVISTPDAARGEEFVSRYALETLPRHVDVGGDWVSSEFNVRTSPSALVFRHGRLESALVFTDLASLRIAVASGAH